MKKTDCPCCGKEMTRIQGLVACKSCGPLSFMGVTEREKEPLLKSGFRRTVPSTEIDPQRYPWPKGRPNQPLNFKH